MSIEQNKTANRRWVAALNTRDLRVIDAFVDETVTDAYVTHDNGKPGAAYGREGVKLFARRLLTGMPDAQVSLDDEVAEGDRVASRMRVSGTDASTGLAKTMMVMGIDRFVAGKVAETWQVVVTAAEPMPSVASGNPQHLLAVAAAFDAAVNMGDLESVMASFAEDAVLKDPQDGKLLSGKPAIRAWFQPQIGHVHVASRDRRVNGATVTWHGTVRVSPEFAAQAGGAVFEETAEAVVQDGRFTSFILTLDGR